MLGLFLINMPTISTQTQMHISSAPKLNLQLAKDQAQYKQWAFSMGYEKILPINLINLNFDS